MARPIATVTVAALLCLGAPLHVHAADKSKHGPPAATPAKPADRADELFAQASTAYDAGRLGEAEAKLSEAWAVRKTYDIAGNLGVVELRLGKPARAAEHLAWALQHFAPSDSEQTRAGYQQQLVKARAACGTLRIRVNVAGAEVTVGGRVVGASPLEDEVFVEAGSVTVAARGTGYVGAQQAVSVGKGEEREVALVLAGVAPVVVARRPIWPALLSGGAALVGIAVGAGLAAAANGKGADAATLRAQLGGGRSTCTGAVDSQCNALGDALRSQGTLAKASLGSFLVGGAFAVTGAGLGIWATGKSARVGVMPALDATQRGIVVVGSW
jgi:hypothetical protein